MACSSEDAGPPSQPAGKLVPTTREQTLVPVAEPLTKLGDKNPALPGGPASYPPDLGELRVGPGEAPVARTLDGSPPPAAGAQPRRLLRFVHLADLQIADDESPTRVAIADTDGSTSAALRPQDADLCRLTNAAVVTINGLHRRDPVDFVVLGGDNADSAQRNEVDWVLGLLGGGAVECDSGADNDLVPGPDNDGKDAFQAPGLAMPWWWVTGNHDVLVQGNLSVSALRRMAVLGDRSVGGTRDWTQGGALIKDGIVPDARRELLDRSALMSRVGGDRDGHGIGDAQRSRGKAFYHFDVPGTPVRFVVLDTGSETGGSDGMLHRKDVDEVVKPALDEARAQGKWVILASHHASGALSRDGGTFGELQDDALEPEAWRSWVGGYDNVVFSLVAHSHQHRVEPIVPAGGGHAWWEVMTASIADFPHQFRVLELWDDDNGWLRLEATPVDLFTDGDPVAEEGRRLGLLDLQSRWNPSDGRGAPEARNVALHIRKPGG